MKNRSPIIYEFGPLRLNAADCRLPASLDRNEALCDVLRVLLGGEIGLTRADRQAWESNSLDLDYEHPAQCALGRSGVARRSSEAEDRE
jgi:hypothetical protein